MTWNSSAEPALRRDNPLAGLDNKVRRMTVDATLEFGRFSVLLRRRKLLADGVPIELGTRAFDLLLVLAQADGSLVTKLELMTRVWRGIVVSEENLKVQVSALRKALGENRDFIRTECGLGYRFTAAVRWVAARDACQRRRRRPRRRVGSRRLPQHRCVQGQSDRRFDPAHP
jgi:DNA-binding winged helix-turn-helix (wHTH) protein